MELTIVLKHPSMERILREEFFNPGINAFSLTDKTLLTPKKIPIYRLKHPTQIIYRCSLPLRLSSQLQLSSGAIAQQLVTHLTRDDSSSPDPTLKFTLEIGEEGVIDCYLGDRSLVVWLEELPQLFLSCFTSHPEISQNLSINVLPFQYTHARCCSLLRLGELEGIIEFECEFLAQQRWLWKAPNPIPWKVLNENREYRLISQILHLVDDIEEITPKNFTIVAHQLCEAFWDFERYCRIWGEIKEKTPQLAQARLGLVAVTQMLLQSLLQERFKVTAYIEM
ncbi:DALR anticodon binding domain protein [Gloeothece citriformis PCC 7424]|uniref:DALR anticodon binding domain protein n=1 Tax=Gloeothece citriformis (strain PCC 7424) TaxID=65393 RepID=B7K9A3_GLOC7|nr:DALR anticodon-binding domain-containing protein [Gloeothece citriformis]ACK68586.1 DALR anticodon binding domain protein [Gloeothece citriformis PCC 7424]